MHGLLELPREATKSRMEEEKDCKSDMIYQGALDL